MSTDEFITAFEGETPSKPVAAHAGKYIAVCIADSVESPRDSIIALARSLGANALVGIRVEMGHVFGIPAVCTDVPEQCAELVKRFARETEFIDNAWERVLEHETRVQELRRGQKKILENLLKHQPVWH